MGDVYRSTLAEARAIGIIDGYFERVPAIWHKEVLYALSQGVAVFGSASMGALRAAELDRFGMVGVGRIYEGYRDGVTEDDDEVAVAHGGEDEGYRRLSEAMVNIRATLLAARAENVIAEATRAELESTAKSLFYPLREFGRILRDGERRSLAPAELEALRQWLPAGRVDRKREDALAMLRVMRERLAQEHPNPPPLAAFERTIFWERMVDEAGAGLGFEAEAVSAEALLEEVEFGTAQLRQTLPDARARAADLELSRRFDPAPASREVLSSARTLHKRAGLTDAAAVNAWQVANHLDSRSTLELLEDEVRLASRRARRQQLPARALVDELRLAGSYPALAERVLRKRRELRRLGLSEPGVDEAGAGMDEILRWHFVERRGQPVPDDLRRYAIGNGFRSLAAWRRGLLREWIYRHAEGE